MKKEKKKIELMLKQKNNNSKKYESKIWIKEIMNKPK